MAKTREEAIAQILYLAAQHDILAIVLTDENPTLRLQAHEDLDVTGSMRGLPIEGSDRLSQRTLSLEIHLRDNALWGQTSLLPRTRFQN